MQVFPGLGVLGAALIGRVQIDMGYLRHPREAKPVPSDPTSTEMKPRRQNALQAPTFHGPASGTPQGTVLCLAPIMTEMGETRTLAAPKMG